MKHHQFTCDYHTITIIYRDSVGKTLKVPLLLSDTPIAIRSSHHFTQNLRVPLVFLFFFGQPRHGLEIFLNITGCVWKWGYSYSQNVWFEAKLMPHGQSREILVPAFLLIMNHLHQFRIIQIIYTCVYI